MEDLLWPIASHDNLSDEDRAWLNRLPVGQEIVWRDQVLSAPLSKELRALNLCDVEAVNDLPLKDRVKLIRSGMSATDLIALVKRLSPTDVDLTLLHALDLCPSDVVQKAREGKMLDARETEQALGLARLIGTIARQLKVVNPLPNFDAWKWTRTWLVTWHPALDVAPKDYLHNQTGQAVLEGLLTEAFIVP
ncbi:hypothetical protein AEAC466_09610 [Asticcacaulis sp. AC466]|nr:hypothetical protein AEAC466_09610 [Asticcacaulis sp. AC466]